MKSNELEDVRLKSQEKITKLLPPAKLDDIHTGTCRPCGRGEMVFPGGHMGGVRD